MVAHAMIHHKLDLAIRLVNAVTGRVIEDYNACFFTQYPGLKAIPKQGGVYLFLNIEKETFEMEIHVYGYESQKIQIHFPENQEKMPIREVYLLPLETPIKDDILTLRGKVSGIEKIEAISLNDRNCCIKAFDAKKRIMSVLNQRNVSFHHIHYGLVNREKTAYESFEVEKEISTQEIMCKQKLEKEFFINQPIARIIFGQIKEDGEYILKVENEENPIYLVRYVVEGETFYQKVDFKEENILLKGHEKRHKDKEEAWEQ